MIIARHFDLNQPKKLSPFSQVRSQRAKPRQPAQPELSGPAKPGQARSVSAVQPAEQAEPTAPIPEKRLSVRWQIAIYVVLVLSILASRFIDLYRVGVADSI